MPAKIRRKNTSITEQLTQAPARFPFFQAVRLLERASVFFNRSTNNIDNNSDSHADNPVGRFTPPNTENLHFKSHLTLGFPGSEVHKIDEKKLPSGKSQWRMITNFLSFTGSIGILPFHYSELLFQRLRLKDDAFRRFLDMFHHRTISLFYQAGVKYRLPIAYERHKLLNRRHNEKDQHSQVLLSLIGMGGASQNREQAIDKATCLSPETLMYYSGFFSQSVRTTSALEQMLANYFEIPVALKEFVGEWHDLIDDVRSRLPYPGNPKGQNSRLGRSAILGGKGWFSQGKIRIELGPLNNEQFRQFGPGTTALTELNQMVKMFTGAEVEAEYVMQVSREHIPHRIQLNSTSAPIIGWDTWLATQPLLEQRKGETLEITVSSNRLG